ncbi:nucleotidyltransferase family protein [Blastococcus deserti]|uniref:Nucleotidyltransferase AbiEii toxin of type IV toxin-antitoxin system n=1 Tax=Blastococcus deserti TaxID=2259033 RepID=A0ABW4XDF8_9ACTN
MTSRIPVPVKHAVRRLLRRPPANARRYLRRGLSVDEFLGRLTDSGVRYAVLRWFETLPAVEPDNDIDLLVSDEDLPYVEALMTPYRPFRPSQKVDLYSVTGRDRTHFGGAPYLSQKLALRVLDRAVLLHGRYRVPSPVDHLDSLAFHAVHHKGAAASGLPQGATASSPASDGRIGATIDRLARELSRDLELSLEGLDRYLDSEGLQPSAEARELLAAQRRRLYRS